MCTVPFPPLNVTVLMKTSTALLVSWLPPSTPNGVLTSYEVYYTGEASLNPVPASFYHSLSSTISAPNTSLVLSDLVPYSNYTISVRAFTSAGPGEYSEVIEDRTEEDGKSIIYTFICVKVLFRQIGCIFPSIAVPSMPLNVTVANKTSTTLLVTWRPPSTPNGVLISYELQYTGISSENPVPSFFYQPQFINVSIQIPEASILLSDLVPYSNYTISVRAFTSAGPGEYSEVIEDRTEEDGE